MACALFPLAFPPAVYDDPCDETGAGRNSASANLDQLRRSYKAGRSHQDQQQATSLLLKIRHAHVVAAGREQEYDLVRPPAEP